MLFDTHVHTQVSPDSQMDPAEAIATLAKQGMGVCFTEHIDYVTPSHGKDPEATDAPRGKRDFAADLSVYPATYRPLQCDEVGLGLEIGLTAAYLPLNRQTAALDGLDYIIGSIHFVDGWDVGTDFMNRAGTDPYRRILTYTREMIEISDFFDSLGHIDYIARYSPFKEKNVLYARYAAEYDAVLTALAERDKALEINTSRLGEDAAAANLLAINRRFYALGGRYVTIGSDAHHAGALGRNFGRALDIAREAKLTPVYYKNRSRYAC